MTGRAKEIPPCIHEKRDCAGRSYTGGCLILYDTDLKGKPCPFYGTAENNDRYMDSVEYTKLYKARHPGENRKED